MNCEVVCDVVSPSLVGSSTPVNGRIVYSCHGDLQVASVPRDPDVLVVVERHTRTVAKPDELWGRNSVYDTVESLRPARDDDWRQVSVPLVNCGRN